MHTRLGFRCLLVLALALLGADVCSAQRPATRAPATPTTPAVAPEVLTALEQMDAFLRTLKTFTLHADITTDEVLAGLLAAVNPRVPAWFPAFVAVGCGMVNGFLNGRTMASTATAFVAAVGIVAALGLVALLLGALTSALRVPWQKVAARPLGSWMAASGLLALAWSLRPGS